MNNHESHGHGLYSYSENNDERKRALRNSNSQEPGRRGGTHQRNRKAAAREMEDEPGDMLPIKPRPECLLEQGQVRSTH